MTYFILLTSSSTMNYCKLIPCRFLCAIVVIFISLFHLNSISPASRTLMMAGVWSMSRETLSNQPFSIRKVKTFRRLFKALWVSALSLLVSSGWYLVLNLRSEFVPERGGQGVGWIGSKTWQLESIHYHILSVYVVNDIFHWKILQKYIFKSKLL